MQNKKVFISHSSKDQAVAGELVDFLESNNCRCWIAPRDIQPGLSYADCIIQGIESAWAMVFISSEQSNASKDCARELEHAKKQQLLIIPFRIDNSVYADSTRSFFSPAQEITVSNNKPAAHFPALLNVLKTYSQKPPSENAENIAGSLVKKKTSGLHNILFSRYFAGAIILVALGLAFAFYNPIQDDVAVKTGVALNTDDFQAFHTEIATRLESEAGQSILLDVLKQANRNLPSARVDDFKIMKDRDKPRLVVSLKYEIDHAGFAKKYVPAIVMIAERMGLQKSEVDTALAGNSIGPRMQYAFPAGFPSGFAGGLNSNEVLVVETWRNDARDNFLMRRFILPEDAWREIEKLIQMKFFMQISFWDAENQLIRREEIRPDCTIHNPLKIHRRTFILNSLPGYLYSSYMETISGDYSLSYERPLEEMQKVHKVTAEAIPID